LTTNVLPNCPANRRISHSTSSAFFLDYGYPEITLPKAHIEKETMKS